MEFVDLHSHVLPGLDDGVRTLEEALELLSALSKLGFEVVCATPHQKAGSFVPSRTAIDDAYALVRQALAGQSSPPTLYLGAENFWDEILLGRLPKGEQPTYTGGKAFLFEISPSITPPKLEETLFQIRLRGWLPVLAHPERYRPLWDSFERYRALGRSAALVVDLGALDGAHGQKECTMARKLVEEGLAHAAASDAHSMADIRAVGAGITWIRKRMGAGKVTTLLSDHPRRILQGELPD